MDKAGILLECGLAVDMTAEQVEKLASIADLGSYPEGSVLMDEDEQSRDIFVIHEGLVSFKMKPPAMGLDSAAPGEKPANLEILFFRGIAGELSFIDGLRRSATVVAMDSVKVLRLPESRLNQILKSDPLFGHVFMRNLCAILCKKVRHASEELKNHLFL
ncbi:MAG: cyclic nucleotide-binding domain-containing protein [Nitrospinae bacterium]|nr:cyclic nucleotide-binding domain-containing protein [Nitrospinota bacterium]MBF0634790.1 cyclic nucleotide-binding domain-containing protein [Nitrospinota bacterium]